jgi:signal peptidase I
VVILIFFVLWYVLTSLALYFLFPKANIAAWKALVPGLNFVECYKMIGKPTWKVIWLFFPIVNFFSWMGMCVDIARCFGYTKYRHAWLAGIATPAMFAWIASDDKAQYGGPILEQEDAYRKKIEDAIERKDNIALKRLYKESPYHKNAVREWGEAIVFAVFAAAFIRMFLIEAYVIPSSSMEGSLLVGDYLFVSKAHYGIRTPMTVLQVPLLHNQMPVGEGESYLNEPSLGYFRLPALQSVERGAPIVFNYPEGDSVYVMPGRTFSVHDIRRKPYINVEGLPLRVRPVDKRDHYIKRCVGVAGDTLEVRNKIIYINGVAQAQPEGVQFRYRILGNFNLSRLQEWGVNINDCAGPDGGNPNHFYTLTKDRLEKVQAMGGDVRVFGDSSSYEVNRPDMFPHDSINFRTWSVDNYGPIYIPKVGASVEINIDNIALYRRIISIYEHNRLEEKNGQIIINGVATKTYTFRQNYYWAMGDNRHNSEDSRFWGFVPEDHVVGKPLFIWFSTKNGKMSDGIQWNRIFTSANKH